jgi:hypothetical protein
LGLPRLGLLPERPGNYRIRPEPAPHCLSTIEAVVEVLSALEGPKERYLPLLQAFDAMVDHQIQSASDRVGPPRRRAHSGSRRKDPFTLAGNRVVTVYAEANSQPRGSVPHLPPELIQWTAERVATTERFAALVAPRRPLGVNAPRHLDVPAQALLSGEPLALALERFRAFLRPDDVLCAWGGFTAELFTLEGIPLSTPLDLRPLVWRAAGRRPESPEQAALVLAPGELPATWAPGRAGRRIAALSAMVRALWKRAHPQPATSYPQPLQP